jgi:hypothetical protein
MICTSVKNSDIKQSSNVINQANSVSVPLKRAKLQNASPSMLDRNKEQLRVSKLAEPAKNSYNTSTSQI